MRSLIVILVAIFAVSCSKGEVRDNEHKADASVSSAGADLKEAAQKTGADLKVAADKAKPDIDRLGREAQSSLKAAGHDVKKAVHEATADSDAPPSSDQQ
jgi:hypothetical protein